MTDPLAAVLEELELGSVEARTEAVLGEDLYWFPVRHHSPAVAKQLAAALAERKPAVVFIEAPSDSLDLLRFVVDSKTKPPVAIYSSYRDDAVELWLLEVSSGKTHPLTGNGAVNVEPRWSPDGKRVAFVSTQYKQRFHIHTMEVGTDGAPGRALRLTEDNDSGLPRYYYSAFDHFLSPTWSSDGSEILFVSNRGHVWGTGAQCRHLSRQLELLGGDFIAGLGPQFILGQRE